MSGHLDRGAVRLLIPVAAWLLGIGIVVICLLLRSPSEAPPVATRTLHVNDKITAADLQSTETKPLVGRFLRQEVEAGKAVTPSMVSADFIPPNLHNTIAAIISMPVADVSARGVAVDTLVRIYRGAEVFGDPGRVVALSCDAHTCSVIVSLPPTPGKTIDPNWFKDADLRPVAPPMPAAATSP